MKRNKLFLGIASIVALLLLIPALIVPTMGAGTEALGARNYSFNTLSLSANVDSIKESLSGTTAYPESLAVKVNPTGTDFVLHVDSRVANSSPNPTGGDANVDKNVTVGNVEMSYAKLKNTKVFLQAEYYIEANSKGTFEAQFINYSGTVNGTSASRTYLNLWKLDLGAGTITSGNQIYGANGKGFTVTVEKEQWNTVSLVVDLETGAIDFYVNNILCGSGAYKLPVKQADESTVYMPLTNITFNASKWNIAKVNKAASADALAGGFYINNARYGSYEDSMKVTPEADGLLYTDVTLNSGRVVGADAGDTILSNINVSYKCVTAADFSNLLAPVQGASMRLTNTSGIRFATQINTAKLNELVEAKEEGKIKNVQIGTLITPYAYVTEAGDFTVDALKTLPYTAKYLDVKATIGAYFNPGVPLDEGFNTCFVGSIIDIKPANRNRLFTGVGYAKITLNDGTVKYIYSYDYTDAATQESKYSRSLSYIASVFVNDSRFEAYRDLLLSYTQGMTIPALSTTSYIKNVQYSYNEFFFQNAAGVACQLIYDGNNGWRLQAVKPTQTNTAYNEFNNMGAAQALSHYLGEEHDDKMMKLAVTQDSSKFTIRAEGTDTYVTLNITGSFNLQFFSAKGVLMNNVSAITASGTNVTMTGNLNSNEAVYGGGETFTAANKRGKEMQLYSYDAYNSGVPGSANENGTYTVIPLFTFSRGSGMFINRYEIMTADWGKSSSNKWKISIDNNLIDCYFYATGNMTDAIYGYTELAGRATLPEEWAQGVLICRYSPDFGSLEGETMMYSKLEDIPGYESLTLSNGGALATTKTDAWKAGNYLYSGSTVKYVYADGDLDGDLEFVRVTKKVGAPMGAGVKAIVEGLIEAGMKPTAMVLEGLGWNNLKNEANYKKFTDVINWLEERDINTTLYMGIASLSSSMPGYKKEYQVTANLTYDVTIENGATSDLVYTISHNYTDHTESTTNIPKSATSDNPDAVGSGTQNYLDITNPEAVDWYINVVWGQLIELGVDGCKIDFCETMPNDGFTYDLIGTRTNWLTGKSYNDKVVGTVTLDYQWYDESVFEGDDVHHAYASYFISKFCQEMNKVAPEGFVVLNRGGGIGMQRNPYMWAGDQTRTELTLTTQLLATLNSGISGLPFMTYDMAGYAYSGAGGYWGGSWDAAGGEAQKAKESEIFARAIQYTAFSTMIQTHGDVRHMYDLSEEAQTISAQYTKLHDELMPYLQKYSQIACETGMPVLRLLVLNYQNDANVYDIDDQYLFGEALLVAPILTLGSTSRSVYLPEGTWIDLLTGKEYKVGASGQTITVTAKLNQIPVFLNAESGDARQLSKIFNGATWQKINGGKAIPDFFTDDPVENDIFKK